MVYADFEGAWRHLAQIANWDDKEQIRTLLAVVHALDSEGSHAPHISEAVQALFRDNPGAYDNLCVEVLKTTRECWELERRERPRAEA
jgi:hypothetical protein